MKKLALAAAGVLAVSVAFAAEDQAAVSNPAMDQSQQSTATSMQPAASAMDTTNSTQQTPKAKHKKHQAKAKPAAAPAQENTAAPSAPNGSGAMTSPDMMTSPSTSAPANQY